MPHNDFLHLIHMFFKTAHKGELSPCAIQVFLRIGCFEILIPIKVVGEEADSNRECHQAPGEWQQFDLSIDEEVTGNRQITFRKLFVNVEVDAHL